MAYKLLICDDEQIICDGLCHLVQWQSLGFEVAALCHDGASVLEYITNHAVDVILTDIQLDDLSGIDIARQVFAQRLPIRIVLISGHRSFAYAQEAMAYNVFEYVTKPVDFDEISSIFTKLRESLDEALRQRESTQRREAHFRELLPFLRKQFFSDLALGLIRREEEIDRRAKLFECGIDVRRAPCCVIRLQIEDYEAFVHDSWNYDSEGLNNAGYNFFSGRYGDVQFFPVLDDVSNWFILAAGAGGMTIGDMNALTDEYLRKKTELMQNMLHIKIRYHAEAACGSLVQLAQRNSLSPASQAQADTQDRSAQIAQLQDMFLSYVNAGDFSALEALVSEYCALIAGSTPYRQRFELTRLFMVIQQRMLDNGVNLTGVTESALQGLRLLSGQEPLPSQEMICRALADISQDIQTRTSAENNAIISKAMRYLEENYMHIVTLRDVSGHVFLSPTYFSQFFKSNSGMTFSDYLLKVRMEHAVRLLKSPENKIQDIGLLVGYTDSKYFSRLFKRSTGLTPSEYRQKYFIGGGAP